MSYGHRVTALLIVFFAAVLTANGFLIHVSRPWASDELHVGKGHSKFPPQVPNPQAKKAHQ